MGEFKKILTEANDLGYKASINGQPRIPPEFEEFHEFEFDLQEAWLEGFDDGAEKIYFSKISVDYFCIYAIGHRN